MLKLNPDELAVESFAAAPGGEPSVLLTNTDPRACPATQGWDECTNITNGPGCETGGCANC
ncbi:MAG TPA: hypothetical protein VF665_16845 [Longimicrobium sp.]|jgi:hypothetical protein|uniref:hypothetical protein n=1 Tax=Longimicrobium sp. TaxID=2029185 RepID=UPI002ED841D1